MYQYPTGPLDRGGEEILPYAGGFWASSYAGSNSLGVFWDVIGQRFREVVAALQDAVDCLAVDTAPVLLHDDWRQIAVAKSQLTALAPLAFGAAGRFGDGRSFGGAVSAGFTVTVPDLAEVTWLFNHATSPSRSLCAGIDFTVTPQGPNALLTFRDNPFLDARWPRELVHDAAGNVSDEVITFWGFRPGRDRHTIHDHFGYTVGLDMPSSLAYRRIVAAVYDVLTLGTSQGRAEALLAAVCDAPLAQDHEQVRVIATDRQGSFVATDRNVYRLPGNAVAVVAVNDWLHPGDPLCDAFLLADLNQGTTPPWLTRLTLGPGLLSPEFVGDLTFDATPAALQVTTDLQGRTRVAFPVTGFPADVVAFWDGVHSRGTQPGARSLANLLDVRGASSTDPRTASLPATVSPLQFVVANLLRGSTLVAKVRAGVCGPLELLRRAMPPESVLIVVITLPQLPDSVMISDSADRLGTGLALPLADSTLAAAVDGPIWLRRTSRTVR